MTVDQSQILFITPPTVTFVFNSFY